MGDITSFKDYITNGLKDEIYDFTNNGICSSCGNCCSHLLPMNKQEVDRIKKYIKSNHIGEIKHLIALLEMIKIKFAQFTKLDLRSVDYFFVITLKRQKKIETSFLIA